MPDTHPANKPLKAALEVVILEAMPDIEDGALSKLVKEILDIVKVSKFLENIDGTLK